MSKRGKYYILIKGQKEDAREWCGGENMTQMGCKCASSRVQMENNVRFNPKEQIFHEIRMLLTRTKDDMPPIGKLLYFVFFPFHQHYLRNFQTL
jgi:hypothetical protein